MRRGRATSQPNPNHTAPWRPRASPWSRFDRGGGVWMSFGLINIARSTRPKGVKSGSIPGTSTRLPSTRQHPRPTTRARLLDRYRLFVYVEGLDLIRARSRLDAYHKMRGRGRMFCRRAFKLMLSDSRDDATRPMPQQQRCSLMKKWAIQAVRHARRFDPRSTDRSTRNARLRSRIESMEPACSRPNRPVGCACSIIGYSSAVGGRPISASVASALEHAVDLSLTQT